MTDEEKKAIYNLRFNCTNVGFSVYDGTTRMIKCVDIQIVLNLIEKQQREIEFLKSQIPVDKIFYYSYKDFIPKDKIRELVNIWNTSKSEFATLPNGKEIILSDNGPLAEYLEELLGDNK